MEVLAALVPVFWEYGLRTVYADVGPTNAVGLRLLMKAGFQRVRGDVVESHDGKETILHMELTNPKYREEERVIRGEVEGKGKGK